MNTKEKQQIATLFIRGRKCSDEDNVFINKKYLQSGRDEIYSICASNKILPWAATTLCALKIESAYGGGGNFRI